MHKRKYLILVVLILLVGCSQSNISPTQTVSPTSTPTNTQTPIPTATLPTETPTETPLPTEIPVNMTLDDWKKVFSGSFIGESGGVGDLAVMVDGRYGTALTDPEEISQLSPETAMIILDTNGEIIIFTDPDEAAEKAKNGAIIITSDTGYPDGLSSLALEAANKAYLEGNKNIIVIFDESDWSGPEFHLTYEIEKYILVEQSEDGRYFTPVLKRPLHLSIYDNTDKTDVEFLPPTQEMNDPVFWIDPFIKGNYSSIAVAPEDYFTTQP